MAKEFDNFDDDEMDEAALEKFETEESLSQTPQIRDYSDRRILIWEEDDSHREACLEVLTDLLVGATIKAVKTEAEAQEQLENDDWDTFVVDFYTEGVSESSFIKNANNYPGSILVAINMGPLTLAEERDPVRTELLRRLFDIEKANTQIHA
jgi:PleD family two-component response regulator